jgi:hypothetical protein
MMAASLSEFLDLTTGEANLAGGELNEVSLTGLSETGAPYDAPAQPTIKV